MRKWAFRLLIFACCLVFASAIAFSQSGSVSGTVPAFDAASVRPIDPRAPCRAAGFYGKPGGRVYFCQTVRMLVEYAFHLQDYQLAEGQGWVDSQWFEINAVPPEDSPSRNIKVANAEPTAEQRLMLQSLLRDRFGFKGHLETKQGTVYVLTRGSKPIRLTLPKDPALDPRAIVMMKVGGIVDGEAEGTNTTLDYFAVRLSRYLRVPVLNETGISGSYDYYLPPDDPDGHDVIAATFSVVDRLGLKIKRKRGPVEMLVIDNVEQPSAN